MNSFIAYMIKHVVSLLLGSGVFDRVFAAVKRWSDREISGLEKKEGVLAEIEIIGLKLTQSAANFAIEAALQYLKLKA